MVEDSSFYSLQNPLKLRFWVNFRALGTFRRKGRTRGAYPASPRNLDLRLRLHRGGGWARRIVGRRVSRVRGPRAPPDMPALRTNQALMRGSC